jgi:hypothetical protein
MKFILINGRTPRPQAVCVSCREPIAMGYPREIETQLCYCDDECYASHRRAQRPCHRKSCEGILSSKPPMTWESMCTLLASRVLEFRPELTSRS